MFGYDVGAMGEAQPREPGRRLVVPAGNPVLETWSRLRRLPGRGWERLRGLPGRLWAELSLLSLAFGYGALLRLEAFHRSYGPLAGSDLFLRMQEAVAGLAASIRPASFSFPSGLLPYRFDPSSYLLEARSMEHFYEARLREPLFVFSTKVSLWLTGGQDLAVSVASNAFSILLVPATYALGRAVGGPAVGLPAALVVAIEPQLILNGPKGYRAELFACLVVAFALACIRLHRRPSTRAAVMTGAVGAAVCLTRITSLAFVVPGLAAVALSHGIPKWRHAARRAAVSGAVVLVLIAPFLVACWVEFGDPFYSINWHTGWYRQVSGMETGEPMSASEFVLTRVRQAPTQAIDTALRGLTLYPWADKWDWLAEHWGVPLAAALKYLCLAGLLMWLWTSEGRLILVVLAGSMLPFAFTWELWQDWRFTVHTYPIFMAAAAFAAVRPVQWIYGVWASRRPLGPALRGLAPSVLLTAGVATFFVGSLCLFPVILVHQELAAGRAASVGGDPRRVFFIDREALFFARGWSPARLEGDVVFRYPKGAVGRIWVPMVGGREYRCLLRLDPLGTDTQRLRVLEFRINEWSHRFPLRPDQGGVDTYWIRIPMGATKSGLNRVEIREVKGSGAKAADGGRATSEPDFKLWFVRFFPEAAATG